MVSSVKKFALCLSAAFHFTLGMYYLHYNGKKCFHDLLLTTWRYVECANDSNTNPLFIHGVSYFLLFFSAYQST